jgi:WD40 repeat protein
VRLKAVAVFDPADKKMSDAIATTGSRPLPPRGLLRIGTEDLRTRDYTITGIAFSPDGKLVAAAVANSPVPRITLFNVNTGRQAKQISSPVKPAGWVTCVAFSPDGSKLVWGEIGGLVAVWDLTQDRLIFRQILHSAKVDDVRFSPDGTLMASAGEDGAVRLRQAADPAVVFRDLETAEKRPAPRRAYTSLRAVLPDTSSNIHINTGVFSPCHPMARPWRRRICYMPGILARIRSACLISNPASKC